MEITKFVDRIGEIKTLEERWSRGKAEFIVIYGRRRIGKTELIKQFMRDKKGLYFLGRLESKKDQLDRFSYMLSRFFSDPVLSKSPLTSWEAVFEYISNKEKHFILALDEFPYIVKTSPEILSILQDYWDNKLKESKIFLIICGSSISMMEKQLFSYSTPLYGRRTLDIKLSSIRFRDIRGFLPETISIEDMIKIYSILGGTPAYLLEFERNLDYTLSKILSKQSFLLREPEFILREEIVEPRYYFSILHAISIGRNSIGEIITQTGLEKGLVGKYLSTLIDLDLVRRILPITASWKSRKGLYEIRNNYFNFWFRFIYPNLEYIETNPKYVRDLIKKELNAFIGRVFEEICREFLMESKPGARIGKWWYKDNEIDIVALDENKRESFFFECKWSNLSYSQSLKILNTLMEKSRDVRWYNDSRVETYGLFGKKIEDKERLREEGFQVYDLQDLLNNGIKNH